MKINLTDHVKDPLTGAIGIVTAKLETLYEGTKVGIQRSGFDLIGNVAKPLVFVPEERVEIVAVKDATGKYVKPEAIN